MDNIKLLGIFKERNFGLMGIISVLILTLIIGLLAFKTRNDQWNIWKLNKNVTFYDNSPLLSTADGPYFIGLAKTISEGKTIQSFNEKRFFPEQIKKNEGTKTSKEPSKFEISLLPISISYFSKFFDDNFLLTSNIFIPIAAFLTAIAIAAFFFCLGFGYEGTIAGLGASLSQSIYVRTSIGRVDTDLLNIGFFYLVLSLIFSSIKINHYTYKFILISLAGITNFCFIWWYQRPGFFILFLFTLLILQFFYKKGLKESVLQVFIFSLLSGPFYVFGSLDNIINYFNLYLNFSTAEPNNTGLFFPDTFKTITELQKLNFSEYSKIVFGENKEWIVLLGIVGLVTFVFFNFQKALILITPTIFLLMSVFIGKRFAIYAIPLYWFGVAYILICSTLLVSKILDFQKLTNIPQKFFESILVSLSTIILILFIVISSISFCENGSFLNCKPKYVPMPSFTNKTTKAFDLLNKEGFDNSSIIVTWWDYGYWLNYFSGLTSVHDGGSQRSPKTYLVAKSLTSTSQRHSYDTINYIVSHKLENVLRDSSQDYNFFIDAISKSKPIKRPVYLYLSRDMIRWWSTITYIGNWDVANGVEKNKTLFERIDCNPKSQSEMICGDAILNVETGSISNGNQLDSLVISQNGKMIRRFNYDNRGSVSLLIEIIDGNRFFYVVSIDTLKSTFVNLYFLNNHNNNLFQLIKDEYPSYKIFKIN